MEEIQTIDFRKHIKSEHGGWVLPEVEFTEDEWVSVYRGCCIDSTHHAYLVRGDGYGTFWIPKCYVRLASEYKPKDK